MLSKISQYFFRINLLKNNFFDGLEFNLKSTRDHLLHWIYNLYRYENVKIEKFSELFDKYDKIVFPVRVQDFGRNELFLVDSKGEKYYFMYSTYGRITSGYLDMQEYIIGKRKYPCDEDYVFKILPSLEILLKERGIIRLKKDNTNLDDSVHFEYDYEKSNIYIKVDHKIVKIEIKYPSKNVIFSDKLTLYFFSKPYIVDKLNDVSRMFIDIKNILNENTLNIKIIKDKEVLSEICMVDNVIKLYSFTIYKDKFKSCFYKLKKEILVDEFISNIKFDENFYCKD